MKKVFLVFSLVLAMALPAFAIDSTALFNSNILGTSIQQGASVTPVGTVITWASAQMPNDGPGVWLECDGRAIPTGAEYQDLRDYLMSNNTPNYQNQFLRGGTAAQVGRRRIASGATSIVISRQTPKRHFPMLPASPVGQAEEGQCGVVRII